MSEIHSFHIMTKPRGAICNLDCAYCYFLKKEALYPRSNFRMSEELLENFTRQYIHEQHVPQVTFAWQGGEPTLMGLDFFETAIEFQKKYAPPGMKVENTFQTNGTLLDDRWGAFFKEHSFLVGISIDGPPDLHNTYRKDKGGNPTFEKVLSGLEILKKYSVDFNILTTVHAANAEHPLQVYRFLRDDLEANFIQFIPIVERDHNKGEQKGNKITDRSVSGEKYGHFLIPIFDEWIQTDVGEVFIQIFDVALGKWLGQSGGLCVFNETCGQALALEHNGDLYSCDHYVEPRFRLGNISKSKLSKLVASYRQMQFGRKKQSTLPHYCLECEVRFACNGGCPKNRILHTQDGEFGLNYLCEGYQAFFHHIDKPMKIMRDLLRSNRLAKDVMDISWQET
jgi:uncharacterized protein